MTGKVWVSLTGRHTAAGETDTIRSECAGSCRKIGEDWYIRYDELQEGMTEPVNTLLKVRPGSMTMTRKGAAGAKMLFETGRRTEGLYATPFGGVPVVIHTDRVLLEEEADSLQIRVDYMLGQGGESISKASLTIRIRKERPGEQ